LSLLQHINFGKWGSKWIIIFHRNAGSKAYSILCAMILREFPEIDWRGSKISTLWIRFCRWILSFVLSRHSQVRTAANIRCGFAAIIRVLFIMSKESDGSGKDSSALLCRVVGFSNSLSGDSTPSFSPSQMGI
jgi:hypothetical protein